MSYTLTGAQIKAVKDYHTSPLAAELTSAPKLDDPLRLGLFLVDNETMKNVASASEFTHHPYASLGDWIIVERQSLRSMGT